MVRQRRITELLANLPGELGRDVGAEGIGAHGLEVDRIGAIERLGVVLGADHGDDVLMRQVDAELDELGAERGHADVGGAELAGAAFDVIAHRLLVGDLDAVRIDRSVAQRRQIVPMLHRGIAFREPALPQRHVVHAAPAQRLGEQRILKPLFAYPTGADHRVSPFCLVTG